jgi:hypothetical protein
MSWEDGGTDTVTEPSGAAPGGRRSSGGATPLVTTKAVSEMKTASAAATAPAGIRPPARWGRSVPLISVDALLSDLRRDAADAAPIHVIDFRRAGMSPSRSAWTNRRWLAQAD